MQGRFLRGLLAGCSLWAISETKMLQISQAEESPADPAFQRVAANLDAGGVIYLYWSAEKAVGELDKKLESVRLWFYEIQAITHLRNILTSTGRAV